MAGLIRRKFCFTVPIYYYVISSFISVQKKFDSIFLPFLQGGPEEGGPATAALVRDLMCAAVHSRAAYGYAMQAGHISSLLSFALLQTVLFASGLEYLG